MSMSCERMTDGWWLQSYIGVNLIEDVRLWCLCLAPLRHCSGAGAPFAPSNIWALGEPREPLCLCMLLFPLHAQTPSPPRCARTGLERFQASQAAPGSRRPLHSAGGTVNPAGSGLDLSQTKQWQQSAPVCVLVVLDQHATSWGVRSR